MKAGRLLLLLAVGGAAAFAFTRYPVLNDVETGKTPEYPDLQPRAYAQGEAAVAKAARAALDKLPRFAFVGAGSGRGGSELQALATAPVVPVKSDVTVRIKRERGATRVSVRSRSRSGPFDLGQNARNVREFLAALDQQLEAARGRSPNQ
ncbi:MAG TPA: DUF1499 domain-containing protein [Vicinamibacteria bacterium]|nr:DUF1499 domain-containing protein [Vicinamibacteria bacterium]